MCNQHPIEDYTMIASCLECRAEVYIGDFGKCAWCGQPACPECRVSDFYGEDYCSEGCLDDAEDDGVACREDYADLKQWLER